MCGDSLKLTSSMKGLMFQVSTAKSDYNKNKGTLLL